MEAIRSSKTLVTTYKTTRRHKPEYHDLHFYLRENLKSHTYKCPSAGVMGETILWLELLDRKHDLTKVGICANIKMD
jgi:hypothetical protein